MTNRQEELVLENIVELLELPSSAYQKAKDRYDDLGKWFGRDESLLKNNDIHIFPQGSFRLGTAIRPLSDDEEYDLDLACKARSGISKNTHSQFDLKELVGKELETYRVARSMKSEKDEKRRCWRLEYQDALSFHMDIVPCIALDESISNLMYEDINNYILDENLSKTITNHAVSITDTEKDNYPHIDSDWNISNPEGYALWFEANMNKSKKAMLLMEKAQVDNLPNFNKKTTLQRAIQLLKRHRDNMFKDNEDSKPISIIITTLATHAYNGEDNLAEALKNILANMKKFINPHYPRIPNPTHPSEDFADKWHEQEYKNFRLEENFNLWLVAAQNDFGSISGSDNSGFISEQVIDKFSIKLSMDTLVNSFGLLVSTVVASKSYDIEDNQNASPWRKD